MNRLLFFILLSIALLQCKQTDPKVVPVLPVAKFEFAIQTDGLVSFKNMSENADSFSWSFGNGESSTASNPEITFKLNKEYTVELMATNKSGQNSIKKVINVNSAPLPIPKFSFKNQANGKVQFTNETTNADSYLWTFGDETTSIEKDPIHEFKKNGEYSVTLEATNINGKANNKINLTISDILPVIKTSDLFLHESGKFVEYRATAAELADWNSAKENNYIAPITKKIFAKFKDSFDFVFIILNNNSIPPTIGYYGKYRPVKNDIKGIGQYIFDYTKQYGSDGKLIGIMQIAYRSAIQNGPTLHELAHFAANYAVPTYSVSNGQQIDYQGHWGFSDAGGQLGGFKAEFLTENLDGIAGKYQAGIHSLTSGFGTFANGGNSLPYSPIELYLMGFAPKEEVPDLKVYSGLSLVPNETRYGVFMAKEVKTYSIDDIIKKNEARLPSYTNSQKNFRILNLVLTDKPLTSAESEEIENQIDWLSFPANDNNYFYNFYEATKGRGTLKSNELEKTLK
jgi:PKD repeat protein